MTREAAIAMAATSEDRPGFPPMIAPFRLRERDNAFAQAIAAARASGDAHRGAGSLHYVGRFELIEFAITLEPEEPLHIARKILFAGMNALADALSVLSPPEKPITFRYPATLRFDGALVGGARLAWPEGCGEHDVPEWLVFGAMLRAGGVREQGLHSLGAEITTLDDEGFEAWNPRDFSALFARHFLVEVDNWHEKGQSEIAPRYLARLEWEGGKIEGMRRGIDTNGDLLLGAPGTAPSRQVALVPALAEADWLDPETGEPRA